jgi:pimeloyl-ACP methyl ester carboxylesterase
MPAADAHRAIDDLAGSTAFEATFLSTREPFSGTDIAVRVTVVFGSVDWILTGSSRHRHCLPAQTTWLTKRGWGHVPMWVDPVAVSQVILEGTS